MAVNTLFLRQQLEQVQNVVVTQDFPERMATGGDWLPISNELNPGAETYSYRIMTAVGEAAILANGADDIPLVSAYVEKRVGEVHTIVNGYEYTVEDIEAAQFANMALDSTLATNAREIMEAKADQICFEGDPDYNLLGILNQPNVPNGTVLADGNENGGTNSTQWQHKTAAQIYRDLSQFGSSPRSATNGVEFFDTISVPEGQYNILAETPYPTGSAAGETILSFYLKTQAANPKGVRRVLSVPYLAGKGAGGSDLMVGSRKNPSKLKIHIPLEFTTQAVQLHNFNYRVPCRMRTGGAQLIKPLAMGYRSGI